MSSVTEMNSPQAVHHTMEGGLNVQTETGTENRGTDTEIWTEEGHERVMRDMRRNAESTEKGTRARKEIIVVIGIIEGEMTKNTAGVNFTEKKKDLRPGIRVVMRTVKVKKRRNNCIKDFPLM